MFYLPCLFHFLDNKAREATDPNSDCKEQLEKEHNFISSHHSPSSTASGSEADGSLSITSNYEG